MPEAPDLEVTKRFLESRVVGAGIKSATVLRPSVLRSLNGNMTSDIEGRVLEAVRRRGKYLLLYLSGDRVLVINPKLTGAIQYCPPKERVVKRICIVLSLCTGLDLRYLDDRQMGMVYYAAGDQLELVPGLNEQGPDVLDDDSFEEFQQRLRPFYGEIKGILTRGRVISGIGNAYSDEILFAAKIYPFRKKRTLTTEELREIYLKSSEVVREAMQVLNERVGDNIHVKIRDFLKVHNMGGLPCPRCGHTISQVTANKRITSYCRRCQPGMLIRN